VERRADAHLVARLEHASSDGWGNQPPALYADGVRVRDYSMEPEAGGKTRGREGGDRAFLPTSGLRARVRALLGLPDEYDYGYESNAPGASA